MILAHHLTKSFGQNIAVDDLSLQVAAGEIYGLVGPDGAGKTTTIRLLSGAMRPDQHEVSRKSFRSKIWKSQESERLPPENPTPANSSPAPAPQIEICGYDMLRQTNQARAQIGYLPQRFSLYEELTVLENLRFFAEVRGLPASEWQPRCMEILRFVGLDGFLDRRAGHLSGGMKQKLGLAAALAHRPRLLLLDEPTTGVDPVTRQDFWQLIIRLVSGSDQGDNQVSVLVSTPYMDEAARCTRLGFMREGRLLVDGTPSKLLSRLDGRILELRGRPLVILRTVAVSTDGIEDARMFGDRIHIRTALDSDVELQNRLRARAVAEGAEITSLRPIRPQLEDVFISLIQ